MELKIENLDITIGDKEIVKDINLEVKDKQFVGIVGPNGSGKSTILKAVYKVLEPSNGQIHLDDLDIVKESNKVVAQHIAVVSQFNNIYFDFSVYEIVMMGRSPHNKWIDKENEKNHEIVLAALDRVGLSDYINRSFNSLSGGEQQRVILARSMVQEPQLLILDEPSNHLDIKHNLRMFEIVKEMNTSVLAVLHDLNAALKYCDYIYVINDGHIVASGQPTKIINKELIREVFDVNCTLNCDLEGMLKSIEYTLRD